MVGGGGGGGGGVSRGGKSFRSSFKVRRLILAMLNGGKQNATPVKGEEQTVLPCLECVWLWGGGGEKQHKATSNCVAPPPLPEINDRSLTACVALAGRRWGVAGGGATVCKAHRSRLGALWHVGKKNLDLKDCLLL